MAACGHDCLRALVGLVGVPEHVAGLGVDPVGAARAAIADGSELPVVAVLAVDVLKQVIEVNF